MASMILELPDFWTTVGLGLALLSLVPGMTSVPSASHIEFKISRMCAVVAAALFLTKLALWGAENLTFQRLAIVALFGAAIAVLAAYTLHWINKKEEATANPTHNINNPKESDSQVSEAKKAPSAGLTAIAVGGPLSNSNIKVGVISGFDKGIDLKGGAIDSNVEVGKMYARRISQPFVRKISEENQINADGTFLFKFVLELESPLPLQEIAFRATGPEMVSINGRALSNVSSMSKKTVPNGFALLFANPSGQFAIDVVTKKPNEMVLTTFFK
jgi:hypothetical protein